MLIVLMLFHSAITDGGEIEGHCNGVREIAVAIK